jgi:hypothetical protein
MSVSSTVSPTPTSTAFDRLNDGEQSPGANSALSWAAIFAGALAASVLSFVLLILGTALGLSSVSPWAGEGASATTFGASTIAWLVLSQIAAAAVGGYLAGRLRARWLHAQQDEVFFRDTAHGFLSWAVGLLVSATILASVAGSIVGGVTRAGAAVASGTATAVVAGAAPLVGMANTGTVDSSTRRFVDQMLRKVQGNVAPASSSIPAMSPEQAADMAMEVATIFGGAIASGSLPTDDVRYLARQVSRTTGVAQADAEKLIAEGFAELQKQAADVEMKARAAADTARKAAAWGALWLVVSMLAAAFCASVAAIFGGRHRDLV